MKGLLYQLKSVRKDKFCIMSFLLPIVTAMALNFIGSIDLSSLGEYDFGVVAGDMAAAGKDIVILSLHCVVWLSVYLLISGGKKTNIMSNKSSMIMLLFEYPENFIDLQSHITYTSIRAGGIQCS